MINTTLSDLYNTQRKSIAPSIFKKGIMTLIPKCKQLAIPSQFGPITLSSMSTFPQNYCSPTGELYNIRHETYIISVNRGVKQGNPMSPILFNSVIMQYLKWLIIYIIMQFL